MGDSIIDGNGSGNEVSVTSDKELSIVDPFLEISRGKLTGKSHINKFGRNPHIEVSVKEDIWDVGGFYTFLTSAETIQISSSSAADTHTTGIGARTIAISGLDANYAEITETINLSGTTAVFTGFEYLRLNRMYTIQTGGSEINIGSINAIGSGTSIPQARISPEEGQTLMAIYTIPSGVTGFVTNYSASFDEGGAGVNPNLVDVDLKIRSFGNGFRVNNHQGLISTGTTSFQHVFNPPIPLDEKTDVLVQAIPTIDGTDLHAGFDIILVDN